MKKREAAANGRRGRPKAKSWGMVSLSVVYEAEIRSHFKVLRGASAHCPKKVLRECSPHSFRPLRRGRGRRSAPSPTEFLGLCADVSGRVEVPINSLKQAGNRVF